MRSRVAISLFSLALMAAATASAQNNYELSDADGAIVCTALESFSGIDDESLFATAYVWAVDNGPRLKENIRETNFGRKSFTTALHYASPKNAKLSYDCLLTVKVAGGQLILNVFDMIVNQPGLMGSSVPFERLNPEKKSKHKEQMSEFQQLNNRVLTGLVEAVKNNGRISLPHWDDVCLGRPVKGMNAIEAKLVLGKPVNVHTTGAKEQWMFDSNTYLIFENGEVVTVLQ